MRRQPSSIARRGLSRTRSSFVTVLQGVSRCARHPRLCLSICIVLSLYFAVQLYVVHWRFTRALHGLKSLGEASSVSAPSDVLRTDTGTISDSLRQEEFLIDDNPRTAAHEKEQQLEMAQQSDNQLLRSSKDSAAAVNNRAHVFYYSWWGTPDGPMEKRYAHWNHVVLPHGEKTVNERMKDLIEKVHEPPDDLGTNFYPEGGPYSSSSPKTIARHMRQIRQAGAGVVVLSWFPPNQADGNGLAELADPLMPLLLDACAKESLKLAIHLEPYRGRSAQTVWNDADYISRQYGHHPALFKVNDLPLIYVYDSYLIPREDWQKVASANGGKNAVYLGLVVEERHLSDIIDSNNYFDGIYTYFAANGFVWGSTRSHWQQIANIARSKSLLTSISVGPGYEDTRIRPWNDVNTRKRNAGNYYRESFRAAADTKPDFISITSFNEWHEGTQIEPAIPKSGYSDYADLSQDPECYLTLTRQLIDEHLTEHKTST